MKTKITCLFGLFNSIHSKQHSVPLSRTYTKYLMAWQHWRVRLRALTSLGLEYEEPVMTWYCQGQRRAGEECGLPPSCPHNNSRADTIDRKWSSELNIRAGWTQPWGEIWALEIRKGTTTKVAFSDLTAQSHITDGPGLHLHLDVHAQHMCTALDAPPKKRISNFPTNNTASYEPVHGPCHRESAANERSVFKTVNRLSCERKGSQRARESDSESVTLVELES